MRARSSTTSRPPLRSSVTYSVTPGSWQADADVRTSDGTLAIDRTFFSAILNQTVSISVLVPADYLTSGLDYPVVWHFHGLGQYPGGQNNRYAATWYPAVYGAAVRSASVRPHITVMVNLLNYSMGIDSFDGALLVEQYFIRDVIPWVRANYRTLTAARYNVCAGFSMGSRAGVYYAFKYPTIFGGAHSYGAPFYADTANFAAQNDVDDWGPYILSPAQNYTAGERARWLACSPQGWLTTYTTKPKLRINYGATDTLTNTLNTTFMSLLTNNSIVHTAGTPIVGVGHDASDCWTNDDGQTALTWIESVFAGTAS